MKNSVHQRKAVGLADLFPLQMHPYQTAAGVLLSKGDVYRRIIRQPLPNGGENAFNIAAVDHLRRVPLYQLVVLLHRVAGERGDAGKIDGVKAVRHLIDGDASGDGVQYIFHLLFTQTKLLLRLHHIGDV